MKTQKCIYKLTIFLIAFSFVFSQKTYTNNNHIPYQTSTNTDFKSIEKLFNKSSIIWHEDFDGELPPDWQSIDNRNFCSFQHTYEGPQGIYSGGVNELKSASSDNGFMILDSDYCNTGNSKTTPDTVDAYLQTPELNLSEHSNVILYFEHAFRYLYDYEKSLLRVKVSNDGENWTTYDVRKGIKPNTMSKNPVKQVIDISEVADRQESVWIRFHKKNAIYYYWMIDDVMLLTHKADDIVIDSASYGGYSIIPYGQQKPINFSANISNNSDYTIYDANLKVDVNYFLFNETGNVVDEILPGERKKFALDKSLELKSKGKFDIIFSVDHSSFDKGKKNISHTYNTSIIISDSIYSRDDDFYTGSISAGEGEAFITGNHFEFYSTSLATSISTVLHHNTQAGAEIKGVLYRIEEDNGEKNLNRIGTSQSYIIQEEDIPENYSENPTSLTLKFNFPVMLEENKSYLAGIEYEGGSSTVMIASSEGIIQPDNASYTKIDDEWTEETATPLIRLNMGNNEGECNLLVEIKKEDSRCNKSNGSATAYPLTGTPPFSFVWNTFPEQTEQTATNLDEGNYTVTIKDKYGCQTKKSIFIQEHGGETPHVNYEIEDSEGCGENNGMINIEPASPGETYEYNWSTGSTNNMIDNLEAGTYSVTITNPESNCKTDTTIYISDKGAPEILSNITNVSCFGYDNGAISVTLDGEVDSPSYIWNTGSFSNEITNLEAGIYSVTVSDSGCINIEEFEVQEPEKLQLSFDVHAPLCYGDEASVSVEVFGGTEPYSYSWDNGITDPELENIEAGEYSITVTDSNDCQINDSVEIQEPSELLIEVEDIKEPTEGDNNGAIYINVVGGTGDYSFQWNHGPTTQNVTNLPMGIYTVTVEDENECSKSKTFKLGPVDVKKYNISGNEIINLYPNPANKYTIVHINDLIGKVDISLSDVKGVTVYKNEFNVSKNNQSYKIYTDKFDPGIYILSVNTETKNLSLRLIIK